MAYRFHRASLHYEGLTLHTASSGAVPGLDALYLALGPESTPEAVAEVRLNCAYLNGYDPEDLVAEAQAFAAVLDWTKAPAALRAVVADSAARAPVRALFDCALWDLEARRAGVPLAHLIAGKPVPLARGSNQTLFLSSDEDLVARADAYVARGFRDLKVRFGPEFGADLRRLTLLRDRFGPDLTLAIDANGSWSVDDAAGRLAALGPLALKYVEQPIPPGDWPALIRLAKAAPMPLMLDESMADDDDVTRTIEGFEAAGRKLWAHLKLIKTGGITPALQAVRRLEAAGVPFMIGQMNEGGLATAAAAHLALATTPVAAELYGADGLTDDPAPGLIYEDGRITVPAAPGLGLTFDKRRAPRMMEN
ncbi:MAG: mandelate racemase [Rhodobacteraceae bacterium]|nr:mandelate racemase [Paracoccaceae bacterium]